MKARFFIPVLLVATSWSSHASDLEMVDTESVKKEQREWRTINMEYLQLKRVFDATKAKWTPLSGAEAERDALLKRIEQATELIKNLSERRYRNWTSASGARMYARMTFRDDSIIRLKNEKGEEVEILQASLSDLDKAYLARVAAAISAQAEPVDEAPKFIGLDDTKTKTIHVKP